MNRFKKVSALKGKVEFVDCVCCTIHFKTKETVCWALCRNVNFIPNIGDVITISNVHFDILSYPKEYYLDSDGTILLNQKSIQSAAPSIFLQNDLSTLVYQYNLKMEHLWIFQKLYPDIDLKEICVESVNAIKFCLLTKLLEHCSTFKIIKILTVQNLHYTMEGSNYKFEKYLNCFKCSEDNEYVIGLLRITENGTYELTDGNHVLPCIIYAPDAEPQNFDNEIVVIIKYVVLGEIYAKPSHISYEYLHVLQSDIVQLKLTPLTKPKLFSFLSTTAPSRFIDKITLKLKNVSLPISNVKKSINFWVEIERENNCISLLCFGPEYSKTLALLQIGSIYDLFMKVKLTPYYDVELNRVYGQSFNVFTCSAVFVKKRIERISYLNMQDVSKKMTSLSSGSKNYISFEGVIHSKHFNGRQSSRTVRYIDGQDFGTPGDISHSLKFIVDKGGGSRDSSLTLYLNNWERKLYPRGLVARMRVRMRCVEITNRYLRSNAMTSISLLGLMDDIKTANLNVTNPMIVCSDLNNLGVQCNFVMRARLKVLNIQSCRIETNPDGSLNFSLKLFVIGPSEALLVVSSKDFLRRLLNSEENCDLSDWCYILNNFGPIILPDYGSKDSRGVEGGHLLDIIKKSLKLRLKLLNWMEVVICSNESSSYNLPVWELLQLVSFDYN